MNFPNCVGALIWSCALAVVALAAAQSAAAMSSKPNIAFFLAADVSQENFGCYGHPTIETSSTDSWAATGMRFDSPYHCRPSGSSIITGRNPHNTGAPELHVRRPKEQIQFPKLLRETRYSTVLAGKSDIFKANGAMTVYLLGPILL